MSEVYGYIQKGEDEDNSKHVKSYRYINTITDSQQMQRKIKI